MAATAYVTEAGVGLGTAFCIRKDGLFLTNAHVVGQVRVGAEFRLILNSGEGAAERMLAAKVLHLNPIRDLALLKVADQADLPALELIGDISEIKLGQDIRILGFLLGPLPAGGQNPAVSFNKGGIWLMQGPGRLSEGIRLGCSHGFDSGIMLDYVYENRARGPTPLGWLIDKFFLEAQRNVSLPQRRVGNHLQRAPVASAGHWQPGAARSPDCAIRR